MLFEFLKNHYELILSLLLVLTSFILMLVKKKPINSLTASLYDLCIKAVNLVEGSNVVGSSEKLAFALKLVHTFLEEMFPGIKSSQYDSLIIKTIEEILSTPHKK